MTSVSIVTASRNQKDYLEEALESVRMQSDTDLEHIVVDGCSTDGTVEWLENNVSGWKHLRWSSGPDSGQSEALNNGFRMAKGEIIGWLNSDDRYRPDAIATVLRVFAENPEIDVVYGDYALMDLTGNILTTRREIAFSSFILRYHRVLYIPTTATFFRRRIFDEGNWLNEDLHYAMDLDLFIRLAARGYRFKHIPVTLADFRLHPASKTCTSSPTVLAEGKAIARHYSRTSRISLRFLSNASFSLCRCAAAFLRYAEKFVRGYYFTQRNPKYF